MDKILTQSLSLIHKSQLKPNGFSKKSATFSRQRLGYMELFNIQGSDWNGSWGKSFYVNCGILFDDLPYDKPWLFFPGTQWASRIDNIIDKAFKKWEYDNANISSVMDVLVKQIFEASNAMERNLASYRSEYIERSLRIENAIKNKST